MPIAPPPPPPQGVSTQSAGFQPSATGGVGGVIGVLGLVAVVAVGIFLAAGYLAAALTPIISTEVDSKLGQTAAAQMRLGALVCEGEGSRYVQRLSVPLVAALQDSPFHYEFVVVDDPTVNAFALPGGFVTVNRGLLEAAESGEEVAGVLAHEIQHVELRHGTRALLRQMGGRLVFALLLGGTDLEAIGSLSAKALGLAYSREQETEADVRGLALLDRAGIDPRGLATFFERLNADVTAPEILSTHPDPGARAESAKRARRMGSFEALPPLPRDICVP